VTHESSGFIELQEFHRQRVTLEAVVLPSRYKDHRRIQWFFRCPIPQCGRRCRLLMQPRRDICAEWACRQCVGVKAPSSAKMMRELKKRSAKLLVRDARWDALFAKTDDLLKRLQENKP
jgi:hypothetical protein